MLTDSECFTNECYWQREREGFGTLSKKFLEGFAALCASRIKALSARLDQGDLTGKVSDKVKESIGLEVIHVQPSLKNVESRQYSKLDFVAGKEKENAIVSS